MDIEQKVVKNEIDTHDYFVWNMDIKQELGDEVPRAAFPNVNTNSMHPIKQELNDEIITVQIYGESMVKAKTEKDCSHKVNIPNIRNTFKYLKWNPGRRTKSKGLSKSGQHLNPNTIAGIIICGGCGNLYIKEMEFLFHFSTNHCMKQKKLLYKTKFHQRNISCRKRQVTSLTILRNLDEDIKNEIEIVDNDLKAVLQDVGFIDSIELTIDKGQTLKRSDSNRHLLGHVREKPCKCEIYSKTFSHKYKLNTHLHNHSGEKPVKCGKCFKTFSLKIQLKSHLRSHTGEKPLKCDICSKTFSQKSSLNRHLLNHTGEKPFKCDICLKTFSRNNSLNTHFLIHADEKPFKCDICLKTFSQKTSLNTHFLSDAGEKPFKCDICLKSFPRKVYLKTHSLSHTGEKPFKCEICSKTFSQKCNLNRHLLSHTGEKSFKCDICLKHFSQKSNLDKHLLSHTGEKPYTNVTFVRNPFHRKVI